MIPVLIYPDPGAAADWLSKAFGFTIVQVRIEDAKGNCELARQNGAIIIVRVRDYGVGLPHAVSGHGLSKMGVGVSGMRERLHQIGGELTVTSAEPGTLVEGKIPLF